jgi:lysophospholipase L1-like esterase
MTIHDDEENILRRYRLAAVAAAAILGVLVGAPAEAHGRGPDYVALGDSYSSGVGAPPYVDPDCGRSPLGYPALVSTATHAATFADATCAGAVTADVAGQQASALSRGTDLVTITIGGNDLGFTSGIGTCLQGTEQDCQAVVTAAQQFSTDTLPSRLDEAYRQIRSRAPHARLIVAGYPRLFEAVADCAAAPLSLAKRTALNAAVDTLDAVIARRAAVAGATFADVRTVFANHGVCGNDPWLNAIVPDGAFHPNAAGYRYGYAAVLDDTLCVRKSL